jgi:TRAP-type C4-dicarboxylate transport system permease large subunit
MRFRTFMPSAALLLLSTTGCQVIADIFQAGIWVGILGVVVVLAVIAFIASRFRGR